MNDIEHFFDLNSFYKSPVSFSRHVIKNSDQLAKILANGKKNPKIVLFFKYL